MKPEGLKELGLESSEARRLGSWEAGKPGNWEDSAMRLFSLKHSAHQLKRSSSETLLERSVHLICFPAF